MEQLWTVDWCFEASAPRILSSAFEDLDGPHFHLSLRHTPRRGLLAAHTRGSFPHTAAPHDGRRNSSHCADRGLRGSGRRGWASPPRPCSLATEPLGRVTGPLVRPEASGAYGGQSPPQVVLVHLSS